MKSRRATKTNETPKPQPVKPVNMSVKKLPENSKPSTLLKFEEQKTIPSKMLPPQPPPRPEVPKEYLTTFQCSHCGNTLITSDFLDKPYTVLNRDIGIKSECKPRAYIENICFHYTEDENSHIFSTLIPNVLHSADIAKPDKGEIYHLLRCEKCKELIGKHYIFYANNPKYESQYCFPKSEIKAVKEPTLAIEEIKGKIVEIREKRIEMDAKILKLVTKVLRKMSAAKALIQGYDEKQKCIIKEVNYLKDMVFSLDLNNQ